MNQQLALKKEGKRRCWACQNIYPYTTEFFRLGRRACIKCENLKANQNHKKRMLSLNLDTAIRYKLYQAKSRSTKKSREFTLTHEIVKNQWIKQDGKCFYTGAKMTTLPNHLNYFSIDRYDSTRGYVPDNIVLCSHIINLMKKDMNEQEFTKQCRAVVTHKDSQQ